MTPYTPLEDVASLLQPPGQAKNPQLLIEGVDEPATFNFFDIPESYGFEWRRTGSQYSYVRQERLDSSHTESSQNSLMQRWLIFGVLHEVLEAFPHLKQGTPGFRCSDLIEDLMNGTKCLSAQSLIRLLQSWYDTETSKRCSDRPDSVALTEETTRTAARGDLGALGEETITPLAPGLPTTTTGKHHLHGRISRIQHVLYRARQVCQIYLAARPDRLDCRPVWPNVDNGTVLFIMVQGEMLQQTCNAIIKDWGLTTTWNDHVAAFHGWGFHYDTLQTEVWPIMCPGDAHVLLGNLNQSTCGLLHAVQNKFRSGMAFGSHRSCNINWCNISARRADAGTAIARRSDAASNEPTSYRLAHFSHESGASDCAAIGLTSQQASMVRDWISIGRIPLVSYNPSATSDPFNIHFWEPQKYPPPAFVAISHAWSEGFGNPTANALSRCVLKTINSIQQTHKGMVATQTEALQKPLFFWIDTLLIPLGNDPRAELRQKAIKAIPTIYEGARATLVLAMDLFRESEPDHCKHTAMKITMCQWMRRLWPLQEAFLSRNLYFVFKERKLVSLEALERDFHVESRQQQLESCTVAVGRQFYSNMLGSFRLELRDASRRMFPATSAHISQIARAVRYRKTKYASHETLAYASLLRFDERELDQLLHVSPQEQQELDHAENEIMRDVKKHEYRMIHFIHILADRQSRVPTVLVFLPGHRLLIPDYTWAPLSLMSSYPLAFDYGCEAADKPAALDHNKGLQITAPAILLSTWGRGHIRPFDGATDLFVQCDKSSSDWYRLRFPSAIDSLAKPVDAHDDLPAVRPESTLFSLERKLFPTLSTSEMNFAVVALELPPSEPRSLALLVQTTHCSHGVWFAQRLGNIEIERISDHATIARMRRRYATDRTTCPFYGDILEKNTTWWICGLPLCQLNDATDFTERAQ